MTVRLVVGDISTHRRRIGQRVAKDKKGIRIKEKLIQ